jgi:hypothetical protein
MRSAAATRCSSHLAFSAFRSCGPPTRAGKLPPPRSKIDRVDASVVRVPRSQRWYSRSGKRMRALTWESGHGAPSSADGSSRLARGWPSLAGVVGPPRLNDDRLLAEIAVLPGVDAHRRTGPVAAVSEGADGLGAGVARPSTPRVARELALGECSWALLREAVVAQLRVVVAVGIVARRGDSVLLARISGPPRRGHEAAAFIAVVPSLDADPVAHPVATIRDGCASGVVPSLARRLVIAALILHAQLADGGVVVAVRFVAGGHWRGASVAWCGVGITVGRRARRARGATPGLQL